jgi:putative PIN family toxin of toxin-antitoxin system
MRIKAFVVIDTNVLVSAMLSNTNAPFGVLSLVEKGNLIPIFDKRMLKEHYKVFHYEKFKDPRHLITEEMLRNTLYLLVKNGIFINDVETIKQDLYNIMPDKDDIPFFEVKESSHEFESMLVTGNVDDYPIPNDPYIVTAKELLVVLQQMDRFIQRDFKYEEVIENLIRTNLKGNKYELGDDLLGDIFFDVSTKTINTFYFEDDDLEL